MKITDIYRSYNIMPNLRKHMLRVGAVAAQICDHFTGASIDKSAVVAACLLHDMGNILKFDLTRFPEFLEPKGLSYWENVQMYYKERFGEDEQVATELILEEIHVIDRIKELKQAVEFNKACLNAEGDDFGKKICAYSDMRVDPYAVVSLDDRLKEGARRYADIDDGVSDEMREKCATCLHQIEDQIFAHCDISPEEITNLDLDGTINSLKNFIVPVTE